MSHFCSLKAGNLCSLGVYLHCFSAIKGNITLITRSSEAGRILKASEKEAFTLMSHFPQTAQDRHYLPRRFFFFFLISKNIFGYDISEAPLAPFLGIANDILIPTPVGRGRRGKINVALAFERRKF